MSLSVTDDNCDVGTADTWNDLDAMFVVYDPSGGFVTGGGWIDSPAGAYSPDEELTGKANFGFVSKYQQGASVPTGQTEFQFKAADLNFHSTDYQWLGGDAGHEAGRDIERGACRVARLAGHEIGVVGSLNAFRDHMPQPGEAEQARHDVGHTERHVLATGANAAGPPDDERYAHGLLVPNALRHEIVGGHHLAVVGGEDDDGISLHVHRASEVVGRPGALERLNEDPLRSFPLEHKSSASRRRIVRPGRAHDNVVAVNGHRLSEHMVGRAVRIDHLRKLTLGESRGTSECDKNSEDDDVTNRSCSFETGGEQLERPHDEPPR